MTRRARAVAVAVQNASAAKRVPAAAKLRAWATHALGDDARGELTVRLVDEDESADLNLRYRGKAGPTNVLSFPSDTAAAGGAPSVAEPAELLPLGDVVVCAGVVAREAREQGKALEAHWAHMVIHGTLHILGFDHETRPDAAVMERRERELLAALGFKDPYSV